MVLVIGPDAAAALVVLLLVVVVPRRFAARCWNWCGCGGGADAEEEDVREGDGDGEGEDDLVEEEWWDEVVGRGVGVEERDRFGLRPRFLPSIAILFLFGP